MHRRALNRHPPVLMVTTDPTESFEQTAIDIDRSRSGRGIDYTDCVTEELL